METKDLHNPEIISKYIDGELDFQSAKLFESELESSASLREEFQKQATVALALNAVYNSQDIKLSKQVEDHIDHIVSQLSDENNEKLEQMISMSVDNELDIADQRFVEIITRDVEEYRKLRERFKDTNRKIDALIKNEQDEIIKKTEKKFKINNFLPSMPQLASLAAVFSLGFVISPTFYSSIASLDPQNVPVEVEQVTEQDNSEQQIILRGATTASEAFLDKISLDNSPLILYQSLSTLTKSDEINLLFKAPESGLLQISLQTSSISNPDTYTDPVKLEEREVEFNKIYELAKFNVDNDDAYLKVLFSIKTENDILVFEQKFKLK